MTGAAAQLARDGTRLHLHHGPIDLIIGADGESDARGLAFRTARLRFGTLLEELMQEYDALCQPCHQIAEPCGTVARRMWQATRSCGDATLTPMAAVAGAVADEILAVMRGATPLRRAFVNNGGDIAIHLRDPAGFRIAMQSGRADPLGQVHLQPGDGIGGLATSGKGGRSLSLGIADSVTVLARDAATADAAATVVANAVDLPGHPAITRMPAIHIRPESDLGHRPVVAGCGRLSGKEVAAALEAGRLRARHLQQSGTIAAAALFLRGQTASIGAAAFCLADQSIAER
ncbi:MAG: UPF0280 family protein [Rhodobacteraceae bacterium]|nr:UPF0280 family protein [Paracoccaceae bacterium]